MFSRRWTINGLLVAAITLIVWLGGYFDPPVEERPAPAIAGFDPGKVDRIEIPGPATTITLLRRAGDWSLVEPVAWPADRRAVERLFDIVVIGDTQPLDDDGIEPSSLGFGESAVELNLGNTHIRFGTRNIIGERRYTMIGTDIYLLPDLHRPLIEQGLPGLVDRRLVPPGMKLTALDLPGAGIRRSENGWEALAPSSLSPQQAMQLASGWQELEASRVSVFGGAGQQPRPIVAHIDEDPSREFLLLSTSPEIIIANPSLGLQYHFRASQGDQLLPPAADENPA